MRFLTSQALALVAALALLVHAQPEVSFSGYLDADLWTDFEGTFYANQELDVGMSLAFAENVSANLYVTMVSGAVPAGNGRPGDRWVSVLFDGFDITFGTPFGEFAVGDLVYQYGGFNYYYYKRLSMITPETFTRGIQYSLGTDMFNQMVLVGIADTPDELTETDLPTDLENELDIFAASEVTLTETQSVAAYYGTRFDVEESFEDDGTLLAGLEYNATFGEALEVKADFGYQNRPFDGERSNIMTVLVEPVVSFDAFSVAASFYALIDPDSVNMQLEEPLFGLDDELFFYIEPGYAFNDYVAAGLPLEYHEGVLYDMELTDDDEYEDASIWIVPTLYVYPADGVEWWFWGGASIPLDDEDLLGEETETTFSLGSEIIVEF